MIPRIIHYCWFGGNPLPNKAKKCIASWKKYLPDYEIKEWNESNFDVYSIPYTREAYAAKKYAFVSDYARFDILYKYGGLYFDTDVEVIKPMNHIIEKGAFMGIESISAGSNIPNVAPGLGLGVEAGHLLYKELIDLYSQLHFQNANGSLCLKTVVAYTSEQLCKHGMRNINDLQEVSGICIYPSDYFCPISVADGKLRITPRTVSIHHYAQSWQSPVRKNGRKIVLKLGGKKVKDLLKKVLIKNKE